LQETGHAGEQRAELLAAERPVVLAPPDVVFGGGLADDEFVGRGARGMFAGGHHHRTEMRDARFSPEHDLLVQRRGRQIPVDAVQVRQAVVGQAVNARQLAGLGLRR
jgi:hypothetical protein